MKRADIAIVGAGVLGTFHAYFAGRKGLKTLLFDRNATPSDASIRNFGMLPSSIVSPDSPWAEVARSSAEIYRAIQHECDITVKTTGSLYLASTDAENRVLQEFAQSYGQQYRCCYIDGTEMLRRYTFVRPAYCSGGLLFEEDMSLDPRRMLPRLIPYVSRMDTVEYLPRTTVVAIDVVGGECVVRDADGTSRRAGAVVVCSGADWHTLFPDHFRQSGLQRCKLQMMRTEPLQKFRLPHSILSGLSIRRYPAFSVCPSYAWLQDEQIDEDLNRYGIHVLLKQVSDGSVIIGDSHEYRGWSDTEPLDDSTDCVINDAILRYARTMVDLSSWNIRALWNGYYLTHPTNPIYEATIDGRVHIVTGIGGKGMTTGPGFARQSMKAIANAL